MNKNKGIILTGVDGFSGRNVFKFLIEKKFNIFGISRKKKKKYIFKKNLLKKITIKQLEKVKISTLIHTAGHHKIIDFRKKPKEKKFKNVLMIKNLVRFCKKYNIKNFIFFSTIDISSKFNNKLKKDYIDSKIKIENILKKEYKKKNFKFVCVLRLPAIIGKKCNKNFILDTLINLRKNKTVELWGYKKKYNNFIHIDDINILLKNLILSNSKGFKSINMYSSGKYTLQDLIMHLKTRTSSRSEILLKNKKINQKVFFNNNNKFNFKDCKKILSQFVNENIK